MRTVEMMLSRVDEMPAERCFHFRLHSNANQIVNVMVRVPGAAGDCTTEAALAAAQAKLLSTLEEMAILRRAGAELWRIPTSMSPLIH